MRDQDIRRHGRHGAELAGCQRPGDQEPYDGEEEGRRPRGGGRRGRGYGYGYGYGYGDGHDGVPGRAPGGPRGFRGPGLGRGPGPWAGSPQERGPWAGGPRRHGHRGRRGDVRAAALALLTEQPVNGYQIIQEIAERSGGVWRPSPGSVYPVLQQLQDEGLIQVEPGETGRRAYVLTDAGREYAAAHAEELRAPWDVVAGSTGGAAIEMRTMMGQLAMAAFQVVSAGTDAQRAQARKILADSRKSLYGILASGEDEGSAPGTQEK